MSTSDAGPGRGYTKIRDIGQGSYGKAVLVQDRENKLYVMKIIDMSRMDSKQRKDAINEVRVLSSLKHPYIVSYRESYTENKNLAIVMDYADGGDLHQRIQKKKQSGQVFPEEKITRWLTEATLALKYLHDKHVLHRDLKSQNLFLTSQDRLRIGDFGISKVLESTVAFAKTTIGTPYYLSPEICMERPYSFSSDIWALGCVLYEMAALRVPFDAQSLQSLVQKITRGPTPVLPGSYSPELRQLCGDLLAREQNSRPSAQEILQRPLIQHEIRRMLREEQSKGSARSSASTAANSSNEVMSGTPVREAPASDRAPSNPPVMRKPSDGGGMRKSPSIQSEARQRERTESGEDDGGLSSRYRQNQAPLRGVGARVASEGGDPPRIPDASPGRHPAGSGLTPGRQWADPIAVGGPGRHGTPGGLKGGRRY
mmetsp:Transcript_69247/g.122511  ORF Transcript_69247/g.122511 Transcript_69247/m.122511 type:complete len:427 (+) Transcript_69247:85-1365(+)|eukprot:CAMPEP_0197659154 /NCGR_PEP_ID=MMETSP1338-20131121/46389_1 /TAXON_ID=43686 ORGANISM="Pelagodinium beii, Strain RCC1491" /NCGR_SAMPLE_ID=MMETSP1338 /ASSEMBLY_ACC=CAM_ASM_000754 /LENGTH=426 /DNA_ID=CAMNT_0043235933 /DNA_START=85 /DNA_END=1365 /DNA_ORIENTATION=-